LTPEAIKDVIAQTRSLTSKPFAMNLWVSMEDEGARTSNESAFNRSLAGLTRGFTGRLARGIHNRLMEELNRKGVEILPYPLQRGLVRALSIAGEAAGRADLLPLWAGHSASLSTCTDASAFLTSLVDEVSEIAGPVIHWSANQSRKQSNS
jgi:nitronate monooxygenase